MQSNNASLANKLKQLKKFTPKQIELKKSENERILQKSKSSPDGIFSPLTFLFPFPAPASLKLTIRLQGGIIVSMPQSEKCTKVDFVLVDGSDYHKESTFRKIKGKFKYNSILDWKWIQECSKCIKRIDHQPYILSKFSEYQKYKKNEQLLVQKKQALQNQIKIDNKMQQKEQKQNKNIYKPPPLLSKSQKDIILHKQKMKEQKLKELNKEKLTLKIQKMKSKKISSDDDTPNSEQFQIGFKQDQHQFDRWERQTKLKQVFNFIQTQNQQIVSETEQETDSMTQVSTIKQSDMENDNL